MAATMEETGATLDDATERDLLKFFGLQRALRSLDGKVAELRALRNKVCAMTSGNSARHCLQDLAACEVFSAQHANELLAERGFIALEPVRCAAEAESSDLGPSYDEAARRLDEEERNLGQKSSNSLPGPLLAFAVLVALIAAAMAFLSLIDKPAQNARPECVAQAGERMPQALKALVEAGGLSRGAHASMAAFTENLAYDWSDSDNVDDPPAHAATLRLQGDDATRVRHLFMDIYLGTLLSAPCRRAHARLFDVAKTPDLHEQVGRFLLESKAVHPDALALVVLANCVDKATNQRVMQLKDHLWMSRIAVGGSATREVRARGVGFVFLGGSLSKAECQGHGESGEQHDSRLGWDDSVLGRISHRANLCG